MPVRGPFVASNFEFVLGSFEATNLLPVFFLVQVIAVHLHFSLSLSSILRRSCRWLVRFAATPDSVLQHLPPPPVSKGATPVAVIDVVDIVGATIPALCVVVVFLLLIGVGNNNDDEADDSAAVVVVVVVVIIIIFMSFSLPLVFINLFHISSKDVSPPSHLHYEHLPNSICKGFTHEKDSH